MATIVSVEISEFQYPIANATFDANRNAIYAPNETLRSTRHAVRIEDADGVCGEYVPIWSAPTVAISQTYAMAPFLIGRDTRMRESIYDTCKRAMRKTDHIGYGALDIALWDLAGKEAGMSVGAMLGQYSTRLATYASTMQGDPNGGLGSPSAFADFAEQCRELGYRAFKIHQHSDDVREEARTVAEVRKRVGDTMTLMSDPSCELKTFADAIYLGRACDEADFFWYEDPYSDSGVSAFAHRKLKEFVKTPLLITEHVRGVEPKVDFLLAGGTDFLRADPELDLGITGAMKIARIAEGFGVDVEFHGAGPAHRHCISAIRNTNFYELTLVHPILGNPLIPPVYADGYSDQLDAVADDGTFPVPDGPGLGVTYDWDWISRHTVGVRRFPA
jgi:L-alanine-DL-glutamate epimerase-like enolase superfamily enzyme